MWADMVRVTEINPSGLLATFNPMFDYYWRTLDDDQRDMLAEQWRPQVIALGWGRPDKLRTVLHLLLPVLQQAPAAAPMPHLHASALADQKPAAMAQLQQHPAPAGCPLEAMPSHVAMWEEMASILHCTRPDRLSDASRYFWQQFSWKQRDLLEGQWRPVHDSLGTTDVGALLHVMHVMMPQTMEGGIEEG